MSLPVFKHTISKFKTVIDEELDKSPFILKYDPAIAFLLIREVNKNLVSKEITNFSQIVNYLGIQRIKNIILERDLFLEEEDLQIWIYGVLSAEISSLIVEKSTNIHRDEAFFAGLIPCLSLLFMMNEFPKYRRIINFLIKLPLEDRVFIENTIFGTNNIESAQRNILTPPIYRNTINFLNKIFNKGQKIIKDVKPLKGSELQISYELALLSDLSAYGAQALMFPSVVDNRELFLELSKRYFSIKESDSIDILQNAMDRFIGICKTFDIIDEIKFSTEDFYQFKKFQFKSKSPVFSKMLEELFKENAKDRNIYIYGETAVGKRLLAAALHHDDENPRKDKPFLMIFADVDSESLEEEFFGIKEGFKGKKGKKGILKSAEGGTLVIKEFDSMPLDFQIKLEKAIRDKIFYRVGEINPTEINDIKFILIGREDIRTKIAKEEFSQSLIKLLNPVFFKILPLRERKEDIFYIADEIIRKYRLQIEKELEDPVMIEKLKTDSFPNNLRDLKRLLFILHIDKILKF
ncbi:MAG: sigma 54-interacting transcriptional regulator [Thermodesulfovibrio sp.]|nr:sigma 54-interacting transcriptional regulator [Thermodesulfovibrio sp.]